MALGVFDIIFKISGASETVAALGKIKTESKDAGTEVKSFADSADNLGKTLGRIASVAAIGSFAVGSLQAAASFDSLERSVATTVGSTAELQAEMARLAVIAELPGINMEQTVKGFIGLRSVKFTAKEAEDALKGMANAIAATGGTAETFGQLTRGLSQMAGLTSVSQEEIRQMTEASALAGQAIENAFGTRSGEMIAKLGLSGAQAARKIALELAKLPQATAGIETEITNIGDKFKNFQIAVGKVEASMLTAFGPTINKALSTMSSAIGEITTKGSAMNVAFKSIVAGGFLTFIASTGIKVLALIPIIKELIASFLKLQVVIALTEGIGAGPAGIAIALATIGAAFAAFKISENLVDKMLSGGGVKAVEATGGTSTASPVANMIASTQAAAGKKSGDSGSGGLANVMTNMAIYAARKSAEAVEYAKSMEAALLEIAKNTGSTRDLLDLRKQTFGGGQLGSIGLTAVELQQGNRSQGGVGVIPQTLIPASTDLERAMRKMMINNFRQSVVSDMRRI
jgi:tape measure domain-containing protein